MRLLSRNVIIAFGIAVVLGVIVFFASDDSQGIFQTNSFSVPQLATSATNPYVDCYYRTILYAVDAQGNVISSKVGAGISGNPSFSIVDDKSRKNMAGWVVEANAYCSNDYLDMKINPTTLTVHAYATNKLGNENLVASSSFKTNTVIIPKGTSNDVKIGQQGFMSKDVESKIGVGDYTSEITFKIYGTLPVGYVDSAYSGVKYYFSIPEYSITDTFLVRTPTSPDIDPSTRDSDQDGIVDAYDKCLSQKETFNGNLDGDGCPDADIVITSPTPEPTPDAPKAGEPVNPVDTTEECQARYGIDFKWDSNLQVCFKPTTDVPQYQASTINAKTLINLEVRYSDGKVTQVLSNDFGKFGNEVNLVLNELTGSIDSSAKNKIDSITYETFLAVPLEQSTISVKSSSIKYSPVVTINDVEIPLQERNQVGFAQTSVTQLFSGDRQFLGASLGKITVTPTELIGTIKNTQSAKGTTLLKEGFDNKVKLKMNVSGKFVASNNISDFNGEIIGLFINWENLTLRVNKTPVTGGGAKGVIDCGTEFYYDGITCVAKGTTGSNDSPKLGQDGVNVCTDEVKPTGFPCDQNYRDTYCDGKTSCELPDTTSTESGTVLPVIGNDECADIVTLAVTDNCMSGSEEFITTDNGQVCIDGSCIGTESVDQNTIFIIAIGGLFVIVLLVLVSRRSTVIPVRY